MRSWGVALVLSLASMTTGAGPSAAASAFPPPVDVGASDADATWILRSQTPDGAIALGPDRTRVWPYLANFAALGLARAASGTGEGRYAAAAGRWLHWYQDHQSPDGVVWEQTLTPDGTARPTFEVDAVDASAGTYLLAVEAWWRATADRPGLVGLTRGVERAVTAIRSLQDDDGLTWATETFRVKYLMDQAEALAGLEAVAGLAEPLDRPGLARRAAAAADRLRQGIDGLWDAGAGGYVWAVHADGTRDPVDWSVLYPDALSQAWAVAFDLSDAERDDQLMGRFLAEHSDWASPSAGWWVPVVWALAEAGDHAAAHRGLKELTTATATVGRAWPFTPSDAGQLIEARRRVTLSAWWSRWSRWSR